MKHILRSIAIVAIATAPTLGAQGVAALPTPSPRIITSGEAQVRVTPDRATILIGVQTRANTAAAASADNARRQKGILDTLRALGLGSDQIATQNYSVYPEMKYEPTTGVGRVVGYNVSNVVRVELRRVDQVGSIIDASLAKGANQINSIQFSSSTAADARRMAMAEAVKDARADAEVLARAAGGTLGTLIELTSNSAPVRPMYSDMAMARVEKAQVQTPIEPGEQVLSASVSVIWHFIPAR
ncbi:MAG: SIMPL domain-containing protein [Gemmatimonadaceae bacterium]